jgi:hypothetical protein
LGNIARFGKGRIIICDAESFLSRPFAVRAEYHVDVLVSCIPDTVK